MSGLPNGWTKVSIRNLGHWYSGGTPSKSVARYWDGNIHWTSPKDMKHERLTSTEDRLSSAGVDETGLRLLPPGSVLVVTRSGILKHSLPVTCTDVPTTINQDLKGLVPARGVAGRYVALALTEAASRILHQCAKDGTTVQSIDQEKLLDFQIPLAPSGEQLKICETLDAYLSRVDATSDALSALSRRLERFRASILNAAVSGRLAPTEAQLGDDEGREYEPASVLLARVLGERQRRWEEAELTKMTAAGRPPRDDAWKKRYAEPVGPETSLPELLEGWCWATLDQMGEVGTGATPRRGTAEYWKDGTVPWVTSAVVNNAFVREPSEYVTEAALRDANLTLFPAGSLLIAMYGEGKTRGKCAELLISTTTNQALAAVVPTETAALYKRWLRLVLEQKYATVRMLSSGGVQPNLNLGLVKAITVPLPPSLEQEAIVREADSSLSVADELTAIVNSQLTRVAALRQTILRWAFEGKLVDQDPMDERASELIARIRSEGAARQSERRAKRAAQPAERPRTPRKRRATPPR